jgi:Glycosyltransferases, probably involved in cell wall biogenesis
VTKISVIIPALNEEEYIPKLLESIERQTYEDYEVILCDGGSTDDTVNVSKEHGAKVVEGDGDGPGAARNKGARKAIGDIMLFIDSDVELTHRKVFDEVEESLMRDNIVGGTSTWKVHDANLRAKLGYKASSKIVFYLNKLGIKPAAVGTFLFVEKEEFQRIGGFDEELPFHEDHDLFDKLNQEGETVCLSKTHSTSGRRVVENGLMNTARTYFIPSFYYMIGKEKRMKEKFKFQGAV